MKEQGKLGPICVIIAGICWGLIGLFTRKLSEAGFDSIQIAFLRNIIAAVILMVFILFKDKNSLKIALKDIWIFIGTGIISIAFFNICYFKSIEMTSLSVAAVLLYTAPAMVMVMSCIFFKEKMEAKKIAALVLAFVGCLFTTGIIGANLTISVIGILIGLGSGLGYALYSIFGTVATRKYDPFTVSFYTFLFAAIGLFPLSKPASQIAIIESNPGELGMLVAFSLISTVAPFILYTTGLKYMEAGKASIMAFIEPMVATICGIVVFKEALSVSNIMGIILIFGSVALLNIKIGKRIEE